MHSSPACQNTTRFFKCLHFHIECQRASFKQLLWLKVGWIFLSLWSIRLSWFFRYLHPGIRFKSGRLNCFCGTSIIWLHFFSDSLSFFIRNSRSWNHLNTTIRRQGILFDKFFHCKMILKAVTTSLKAHLLHTGLFF
jgi:hypothetical protein